MRAFALCVFLVIGCSDAPPDVAAPPQPDKLSELRNHDPTHPSLRPNPKPAPSMIGCFSFSLPNPHLDGDEVPYRFRTESTRIEATGPAQVQEHYRLSTLSGLSDRYQWKYWKPIGKDMFQIHLSTGFHTVVFTIRIGSDLTADAAISSDSGFSNVLEGIPVQEIPCPEGTVARGPS